MIPPIKQPVITPIEFQAKSVYDIYAMYRNGVAAKIAAQNEFRSICIRCNLTRAEAVALSEIAQAMIEGGNWKK